MMYLKYCNATKFKELTNTLTNIVLVKVDVDEAEEVAEKYDVSVMPTFVVLKNGSVVGSFMAPSFNLCDKRSYKIFRPIRS